MATILCIETSTDLCSAAIVSDGKVLSYKHSDVPRVHASMTSVYAAQALEQAGISIRECDAVCVSMGPGSYTGLRVGVSTAKGLCFGAGIPLLAVETTQVLVEQAARDCEDYARYKYVVPMIDARRMEVYTAVFRPDGTRVTPTEPLIVEPGAFGEYLGEGPVLFVGDGADKCRDTLSGTGAGFLPCCPQASAMALCAQAELDAGRIRDTAYFEPFYLKEFVATQSKKKLW